VKLETEKQDHKCDREARTIPNRIETTSDALTWTKLLQKLFLISPAVPPEFSNPIFPGNLDG
jgi:hypothetical protein